MIYLINAKAANEKSSYTAIHKNLSFHSLHNSKKKTNCNNVFLAIGLSSTLNDKYSTKLKVQITIF